MSDNLPVNDVRFSQETLVNLPAGEQLRKYNRIIHKSESDRRVTAFFLVLMAAFVGSTIALIATAGDPTSHGLGIGSTIAGALLAIFLIHNFVNKRAEKRTNEENRDLEAKKKVECKKAHEFMLEANRDAIKTTLEKFNPVELLAYIKFIQKYYDGKMENLEPKDKNLFNAIGESTKACKTNLKDFENYFGEVNMGLLMV